MRRDENACIPDRSYRCFFQASHTKAATMTEPGGGTAAPSGPAAMNIAIESALSNLKPLRDLGQNWDIDIASW